jgi:hypothetical protein
MAVARDVVTRLENLDVVARVGQLVGDDSSGKSSTDNGNIFFHSLILFESVVVVAPYALLV